MSAIDAMLFACLSPAANNACIDASLLASVEGPVGQLWGRRIYLTPLALRNESVRVHRDRGECRRHRLFAMAYRWKPSAYHKRIQKKWDKRFGVKEVPAGMFVAGSMIVHPDLWDRLVKELGQ